MERWPSTNSVRAVVDLFENHSKKGSTKQLNRPLSKSLTALSKSESKQGSKSYDNHEAIHNIEQKLKSYISRIKQYEYYTKEIHITHQQGLINLLTGLVNIETGRSDVIIAKKEVLVKSIETQFEELNNKLPEDNVDFTYKPYALVGKSLRSSQNSLKESERRKCNDIIGENGSILGTVEKLKAIFDSSSNEKSPSGKMQVKSNYPQKSQLVEDAYAIGLQTSVAKKAAIYENQKTGNENVGMTKFPELKEKTTSFRSQMSLKAEPNDRKMSELPKETKILTKRDMNEITKHDVITDNLGLLKYVEVDTQHGKKSIIHQTTVLNRKKSDIQELHLNSKCLNEISRNKDGMQNVSNLKKLFEFKTSAKLSKNQNLAETQINDSHNVKKTVNYNNTAERTEMLNGSVEMKEVNTCESTEVLNYSFELEEVDTGENTEVLNDSVEIKEVDTDESTEVLNNSVKVEEAAMNTTWDNSEVEVTNFPVLRQHPGLFLLI